MLDESLNLRAEPRRLRPESAICLGMNDNNNWKLWTHSRNKLGESLLWRYGVAVMLPVAAALVVNSRPVLSETPFFLFLGAVALSAVNGGLAPGFLATGLSALLIRLLFIHPPLTLFYGNDFAGMERMGGFILVSMMVSSLVSAVRRERNLLRDSEERYRILAETASDAIIVIDEKGEILYVNPVTEKTFGTTASVLLGQNLTRLLPCKSYQPQLTELKRNLDTRKKAVAMQLPGLHQSGEHLLVEMTLGTFSRHGRNVFTAIIRDISHKRPDPAQS